ncbi:MAG: Lrp/AsnC family transcriptional regulator [Actinomycetia bacterium]|nr:Lrp/AsnC family transcriptional regulator [Actinomycetes bacterium]
MKPPIDALDAQILSLFGVEPRIGVLEASRRLSVARGTVQARLDRLESQGVVTGWGPEVDPVALGFEVSAFVTLEISQRGHRMIETALAQLPEVLEAHTTSGSGDMIVRVVARTNADLQRVVDAVLTIDGVERSNMVIVLANGVPYRTTPLLERAAGERGIT